MTAQLAPLPFLRRLHVRIGAVTLGVLVLMAAALMVLTRTQQERASLEWTQRMNLGLARYIIEHQPRPLLMADGRVDELLLRVMALDVMMTNPALEVYLLDAQGRILSHAIEGAAVPARNVNLGPVRQLLGAGKDVALPLLGDDPRDPRQRNVFSAVQIGPDPAAPMGYLYVVLRGQAARGLAQGSDRSSVMRETTLATLLAVALAAATLILSMLALTRPLRRLTAQAHAFRHEGLITPEVGPRGDEIALLESTLKALQSRVAEQFDQLEKNDRLRRELVSNLSHDLHTPLASIQGYVERCIIRNEQLTPAEREHNLRVVLRHCASLGKRIADLFELSKLDAGRMQPRLEVFCLSELLHDVTQAYQLQAEQRKVMLQLTPASLSGDCVRADIALLERVFQNLIDNALRYTPAGGAIHIDIQPRGDELRVSVSDTGAGIAPEHLAHVFDRYWRAQDARSTVPGPSSGLGLAIVKRILELHGSVIRVTSQLAGGTRFDFSLARAG